MLAMTATLNMVALLLLLVLELSTEMPLSDMAGLMELRDTLPPSAMGMDPMMGEPMGWGAWLKGMLPAMLMLRVLGFKELKAASSAETGVRPTLSEETKAL